MRFKKGDLAKKLPKFTQVLSVDAKVERLQPVAWRLLMGMRGDNQPIPPGHVYWTIDPDGWLQIHPVQEKELVLKVRYLPPPREI